MKVLLLLFFIGVVFAEFIGERTSDDNVCKDTIKAKRCKRLKKSCSKDWVQAKCPKTCEKCTDEGTTTTASPSTSTTTMASPSTTNSNPNELKVLFLGNSYTSGLPQHVKKLAQSDGNKLNYVNIVKGGAFLSTHATTESTVNKIKEGGWDAVILQEQSQVPVVQNNICSSSKYGSQKWAKELVDLIRTFNPNARIIWYLTWGRRNGWNNHWCSKPCSPGCEPWACETFEGMQDGLTDTYTTYACGFKPSTIAPVGEAYRIFKNEYPDEFGLLYKPDGSHPSSDLGRYLGACVHYSTLFGKPCLGNSYLNGLSNENATNIQMVADAAISEADWNYSEDTNCELSFWC